VGTKRSCRNYFSYPSGYDTTSNTLCSYPYSTHKRYPFSVRRKPLIGLFHKGPPLASKAAGNSSTDKIFRDHRRWQFLASHTKLSKLQRNWLLSMPLRVTFLGRALPQEHCCVHQFSQYADLNLHLSPPSSDILLAYLLDPFHMHATLNPLNPVKPPHRILRRWRILIYLPFAGGSCVHIPKLQCKDSQTVCRFWTCTQAHLGIG
jgi:hypothetical protein